MEFRVSGDWRARQTRGYTTFAPLYPRAEKSEFNRLFPDAMLSSITHLNNPLQKNLADTYGMGRSGEGKHDTVFRGERYDSAEGTKMHDKRAINLGVTEQQAPPRRGDFFPALFGFTNYIAGFFHNITGAMPFHQNRPPSPEKAPDTEPAFTQPENIHYDSEPIDSGFDEVCELDASPPIDEVDAIGHFSRRDCAKNSDEAIRNETDVARAQCDARGGAGSDRGAPRDMSGSEEVHAAEEHCRGKMARIQELLARKNLEALKSTKIAKSACRSRPRRVFVEPKAVSSDSAEPFDPEPLGRIGGVVPTNYVNPGLIAESELMRVENLPKVKLEDESKRVDSLPDHSVESMKTTKNNIADTVNGEVSDKSGAGNIENEVKPAVAAVSDAENKYRVSDETKVIDENVCGLRDARTPSEKSAPTASETKAELIASCEDKVSKLRALLFERKKKNRDAQRAEPERLAEESQKTQELSSEAETKDVGFARKADTRRSPDRPIPASSRRQPKHHKNPHRLDVRKQNRKQLRRNIDEDARLAREVDGESISENDSDSPKIAVTPPIEGGFDEIRGQFGPKDDPFVIVFSDSPPASPAGSPRGRLPSDCSDDSFIICFEEEDGGGCCFTADDLDSDSDGSDSDSDSGCESNLASVNQSLSRTVSDLTDESLYLDDGETLRSVEDGERPRTVEDGEDIDGASEIGAGGMLLTEAKKIAKRNFPAKRVRFSEAPPSVRVMRVWLYAARQARAGNWRQLAIDNERFKRRIADVDMAISWVLKPQHRARVKFQRFMPLWHAQRRQEAADRKVAAEKLEEDRIAEETRLQEEMRAEEERLAEEELEKNQQATQVIEEYDNLDIKTSINNHGNMLITNDPLKEHVKERIDILKEGVDIRNDNDELVMMNVVDLTAEKAIKHEDMIDRIGNAEEKEGNERCMQSSVLTDIKHENADVSNTHNNKNEINVEGQFQTDVNYSMVAHIDTTELVTKANCTDNSNSNLDRSPNCANPVKTDGLINATKKGFNVHKNGYVNARTIIIDKKS